MKIDILDKAYLGMGLSRYTGFEFMKCVNVDDYGIIKLNFKPAATAVKSGESFSNLPFQIGYGRSSASAFIRFCIGSGFIKYWNITNSEWTALAGVTPGTTAYNLGFGFYAGSAAKDYLIYPASTAGYLSALDCSSTASPSVSANFITTLETGAIYRPFFTASDNRLYIGNKRYVAVLYENSGSTFAPGTPATFTFTAKKLSLGSSDEVHCFGEWNEYLVIGTKNPANLFTSDLFLWDMTSPSYDRKISVNVPGGINSILVHKNYIYFQAGDRGEWFVTAGGAAEKVAEIPKQLLPTNTAVYPMSRGVIGDRIYFGGSTYDYTGIWSFDTRMIGETFDPTNRGVQACQFEHTISTGEADTAEIGGFLPLSNGGFLYGWSSGASPTYGVDSVGITGSSQYVYATSEGVVISKYYPIAGIVKKTLKSEFRLAKPLVSGESVKIYYRSDARYDCNTTTEWKTAHAYSLSDECVVEGRMYYCINPHTSAAASRPGYGASWRSYWSASWKLHKTIDTAGQTIFDCGVIPDVDSIQFKYVLDTAASQTSGPELFQHFIYD